jgi:MFS family permease
MTGGPSAGWPGVRASTIILLVGAMCVIHLVSQFLRNSVGVIAPDLARDIGMSAVQLGFLSSAFFLGFAGAQIPLGVAIDRWGPRLAMSVSMGVAVLGVILFAMANSPFMLTFARIVTGLGCASFFMGPLTIYSRWFPPQSFSTLTGIQLAVSGLGVLAATAPLAYATAAFGWRSTFLAVAVFAALVGLFTYIVARDYPPGKENPHKAETLRQSFLGIAEVVKVRSFLPVFAMQFVGYATFLTLFGLWAGPYLAHVYGYDLGRRGEVLFVLAMVHLVASGIWGPLDRFFDGYKRPTLIGGGVTVLSLLWLAVVGKPDETMLLVWFLVFGFFASCTALITAHGRSLFPPRYVGRGLTVMNLSTMTGVFVLQSLTGGLVGLFDAPGGAYPLDAYRAVFAFQAFMLSIALGIYLFAHDPLREAANAKT